MGGLSPWHIILVAVVALLLFGPNKLPELGRGFGKMFREFKDATTGNGGNQDEPALRKEINPAEPSQAASSQPQAQQSAPPQQQTQDLK